MRLHDHLLTLERQLLTPHTRTDPAALTALLTPDFREFGASGRVFDRPAILAALAEESGYTPPEIRDFQTRELTPTLALVTYRAERPSAPGSAAQQAAASLRSSLWTHRDNRWQLLFHQGTRIP